MKISKQVIVIRKDLNMRKGKMCSQSAHASLATLLNNATGDKKEKTIHLEEGTAIEDWINGRFTKICVSVNSEQELDEIYQKAKDKGLICALITDAGLTEFNGVPTKTCCAIGPNWSDEIDEITGGLPLL